MPLENWNGFETKAEVELIIGFDPVKYEEKLIEILQSSSSTIKRVYIFNSTVFLHYKKWLCMNHPKLYYMDPYFKVAIKRNINYEYVHSHVDQFNRTYFWL